MNNLKDTFANSRDLGEFVLGYFNYLNVLQTKLNVTNINDVINCFITAREKGKTIYFAGNGGSAATASHFAQDLGEVGRKANVKSFKTISLADNVSLITAIGNDYGYEKIFSIQLSGLFNKGDVLVVVSASGNSPNVIDAVKQANEMGGKTIGLVGFDGGKLLEMCDYVIHVKTNKGEFGPVEDLHMILDHMVTSFLVFKLMNEKVKNK